MAVDAAVAIRTLPEPAIDCLLYRMQEVLAHLECGTDTVIREGEKGGGGGGRKMWRKGEGSTYI